MPLPTKLVILAHPTSLSEGSHSQVLSWTTVIMAAISFILATSDLAQADLRGPIHMERKPLSITREGSALTLGSVGTAEGRRF